ncbi:MFS transporter [Devosia neptuniae]|uniref:MFS transporter n=1 Tax=Devosia neptuniae TaxID=191302 RepID=A0ABY6CLS6_9HYPH|nr:MFS transporter [Devosia neptuniae]UXN70993.1 MFS transporter [Devosia neptuniae]
MAASSSTIPETSAEHDARVTNAHHRPVHAGEIAIGVIIGRTSEFFDFFVYAIASVLVFPAVVFPYVDPLTGTLLSFAVFALAFVARPIGTVIFSAVDRNYGRGVKLTIALFLLGISTVAVAFLPSDSQVGAFSVAILMLFRFGQGIALAGTWDGLASLLALNAPPNRRGWYAMVPQLGAPIGLIVASALFAFLVSSISAEDFLAWGWRYPFFVAFAINVVALFARLRIVVTPEYTGLFESGELEPTRIRDTVRSEGRNIVIGAFAPLASFALFHMVTVFPLSWVFLYTDELPARFLVIEATSAVVGLAAVVLSGALADRVGRRWLLGASAVGIAIYSVFAPLLLGAGDMGEIIYMVVGFILLGLSFGQSSGVVAANFTKLYRYTSSALTSDLAWLFGAGFAPFVALALSSQFGLISSGAYLLSGAICTLIALGLNRQLAGQN